MKDADLESLCRNSGIRVRRELGFSQDQSTINFALFAQFQIGRKALETYFRSCQSDSLSQQREMEGESSFCNAKPTGFNFCECSDRHGVRQLSEGIRGVQTKTEDTDPSVYCDGDKVYERYRWIRVRSPWNRDATNSDLRCNSQVFRKRHPPRYEFVRKYSRSKWTCIQCIVRKSPTRITERVGS